MDEILLGVMKFRRTFRSGLVEQFKRIKAYPQPRAVFFTCIDTRLLPARFVQAKVGDMFVVRNAGNYVPHSKLRDAESMSTAPAALELGCIVNNIKHVIVCGHSDCKAMNLLHTIGDDPDHEGTGPLQAWVKTQGNSSLVKFHDLRMNGYNVPVSFEAETPERSFTAYIDPENKFNEHDKLSQ